MQPILKLENVWKIYKMGKTEVPALQGLNLDVYEKEFIVIKGVSGSGKTTLLNLIGCLDIPTKGKISLDGKDISKLTESELAKIRGKKIGFVFQKFNLISSLNALENIMLPVIVRGKSFNKKKAMELLELVGMEKRANHKPSELSGGETQRIAIARALINDPEIILADEPTGNLDSKTSEKIVNLLLDLHKNQGKTIIIVTHDPAFTKLTKKVFNLKDGAFNAN